MGKISQNKNTNVYCSVYGCSSYSGAEGVKSFHLFPKENSGSVVMKNKSGKEERVNRRLAWELKLKMGKKASKYMRICSLHFSDSNYIPTRRGTSCKRHMLKETAVPDQNLPKTPVHGHLVGRGSRSRPTRKKLFSESETTPEKQEGIAGNESVENLLPDDSSDNNDVHNDGKSEVFRNSYSQSEILPPCDCNVIEMTPKIRQTEDKGTQTEITEFLGSLNNDKKLNTATGLQSHKMLNALTSAASQILSKTNKKKRRNYKISLRDRIALTLTKLKQNLSFVMLSLLFGMSNINCKRIFHDTIAILSVFLKPAIPWPSFEATQKLLPLCFANFPKVRIVLDCTEITIQRPKCLNCRVKIYSHYKSNNTVKFMTGVSPDGQIIYVSKAYGGRASDKKIFEDSPLLEKLEPNRDQIMADKGFLISDLCALYRIKLVRPPFYSKKKENKQFSKPEAIETRGIAKARVHVERANQRIKIFKFFSGKIDWSLLPVVEDCFLVVCALVNLSSPILANERFTEAKKERSNQEESKRNNDLKVLK